MRGGAIPFHALAALAALTPGTHGESTALEDSTSLVQLSRLAANVKETERPEACEEPTAVCRQPLSNIADAQYIGYMTVGGQLVGGIIDTGSFELVVFPSSCSSCGDGAAYTPRLDEGFEEGRLTTLLQYTSGDVHARQVYDRMTIGPFTDDSFSFWEVSEASVAGLYNAAYGAIIGIGPPETVASDSWKTVQMTDAQISELREHHQAVPDSLQAEEARERNTAEEISEHMPPMLQNFNIQVYSYCLGSTPNSDGWIVWNDDSAFTKPSLFTSIPLLGNHTWSVKMDNFRMTGRGQLAIEPKAELACQNGCSAILDTGTSLLAVPSPVLVHIQDMIDNLDADCSDMSRFPNLEFDLGGVTFSLPPDSYVGEAIGAVPSYLQQFVKDRGSDHSHASRNPRTRCQPTVVETMAYTEFGPLWILGSPFFRQYYTTFKVGPAKEDRRIFLARASSDCYPESASRASSVASLPKDHVRKVNMSMIQIPNLARKAATHRYVRL